MSSDSAKPEGEHDPKLDPQAPLWQWMGKPQPRSEPTLPPGRDQAAQPSQSARLKFTGPLMLQVVFGAGTVAAVPRDHRD